VLVLEGEILANDGELASQCSKSAVALKMFMLYEPELSSG